MMTLWAPFRPLLSVAILVLLSPSCHGLAISKKPSATVAKSRPLAAVSSSQVAALDGPEWHSLQLQLVENEQILRGKRLSEIGKLTIVTGSIENDGKKQRVVGIQAEDTDNQDTVSLDDSLQIYKDSMAAIPPKVSEETAMSTLLGALVGVHCALPKADRVGGGDDFLVSGKVVVMGGSDYASFCSEALATLGANVVQVSTGSLSPKHANVDVLSPAVGELDLGFCDVIGEFDVLLDCIADEAKLDGMRIDDDDLLTSGVVAELRKQHQCQRYVSTMSESQRIVWKEGVLWGPNKASSHLKQVSSSLDSTAQSIVPPRDFSWTLQTLFDKCVVWKQKKEGNVLMRGWNLKDFWELSSWPRDASGTGDLRYGLPVLNVDSMLEERFTRPEDMISEPPSIKNRLSDDDDDETEEERRQEEYRRDFENPHVKTIRGVAGMQSGIVEAEEDCLLFLSATWCRTCQKLSPRYTRMARENSSSVMFAKAEASGNIGKALSKALDVNSVPVFILFRQGQVFGSPLSVSRLPSKKLENAVECLASGMEWDDNLLDEEDE